MAKPRLRLVSPATVKRTVMPRRRPNAELRRREHLTEAEVERLMEAAKGNRWGHRDAAMVLVAYRHGLRASELVGDPARPQGQEGYSQYAPCPRGRVTRPTAVAARARAEVPVRRLESAQNHSSGMPALRRPSITRPQAARTRRAVKPPAQL
jgi:hypothetical protein